MSHIWLISTIYKKLHRRGLLSSSSFDCWSLRKGAHANVIATQVKALNTTKTTLLLATSSSNRWKNIGSGTPKQHTQSSETTSAKPKLFGWGPADISRESTLIVVPNAPSRNFGRESERDGALPNRSWSIDSYYCPTQLCSNSMCS